MTHRCLFSSELVKSYCDYDYHPLIVKLNHYRIFFLKKSPMGLKTQPIIFCLINHNMRNMFEYVDQVKIDFQV